MPENEHFLISKNTNKILINPKEEITYFDKSLNINPNNTVALINKGIALNNLGNYTEAIKYFDIALTINPNNTVALKEKMRLSNNINYTNTSK